MRNLLKNSHILQFKQRDARPCTTFGLILIQTAIALSDKNFKNRICNQLFKKVKKRLFYYAVENNHLAAAH